MCVLAVGCKNTHSDGLSDTVIIFPDSIEAKWDYLTVDGLFSSVTDIYAGDSVVYILGMNDGKCIHLYKSQDGQYINSYVTRGTENGQLEHPGYITMNHDDKTIGVFDFKQDLSNDLKCYDASFSKCSTFDVGSLYKTIHGIYELSDGKVLINRPVFDENGRSAHRNSLDVVSKANKEVLSSFEGFEPSDTLLGGLMRMFSFKNDGTAFATVILNGGALELYKITGDSISRTFIKSYFEPLYIYREGQEFPVIDTEIQYGFREVAVSDDYIYATYCESKEKQPSVTTIGVWDWKGNPVKKIKTDRDIWYLNASPDGKRLYCVEKSEGSSAYQLFVMDL